MRSRYALVAAATILVVGLIVVAVGVWDRSQPSSNAAATPSNSSPTGTASPIGPATGAPSGGPKSCSAWGCPQDARFTAARSLIGTVTNGHVGIEVKDRVTGAVWVAGEPDFRIWAGSTPKLAFAVALREEARAGQIVLDATANSQITAMLHVSDNVAADTLWDRYARSNPTAWMNRFKSTYGMSTASYVSGFPSRWGFVKCTPKDLAALMAYVLEKLNATDRAYVVGQMKTVGDIQHWGVWGAGASLQPGVKDGWSVEKDGGKDHWITATVGFVGPNERYIVAAMYHQNPGGDTIDRGVHLLTDLIATVFGAPVPAPVVIPPPDT